MGRHVVQVPRGGVVKLHRKASGGSCRNVESEYRLDRIMMLRIRISVCVAAPVAMRNCAL